MKPKKIVSIDKITHPIKLNPSKKKLSFWFFINLQLFLNASKPVIFSSSAMMKYIWEMLRFIYIIGINTTKIKPKIITNQFGSFEILSITLGSYNGNSVWILNAFRLPENWPIDSINFSIDSLPIIRKIQIISERNNVGKTSTIIKRKATSDAKNWFLFLNAIKRS